MTNKTNLFVKGSFMLLGALILNSCTRNVLNDSDKSFNELGNPDKYYGGKGNDYNGDGYYGGFDEFMGDSSTSEDGVYIDNEQNMHILASNTQSLEVILGKYQNRSFDAIYYNGDIFKTSEYKRLSMKLLIKE